MFRSSDVATLKPSYFDYKYCILGIGKGILLILLFSSLKSEMKRTVLYFLGMIKVGASHLDLFLRFDTTIFINVVTSVLRVSLCILGIGKDLTLYGVV